MENFEYLSNRLQCPDADKDHALQLAKRICGYASLSRVKGPLALESQIAAEPDSFLQDALRRVVDAEQPQTLREALWIHILAANERGKRFLELVIIADGVFQLQAGMHPYTLLKRLGEWFGESYQPKIADALQAMAAEKQAQALQARAQREAKATQLARAQMGAPKNPPAAAKQEPHSSPQSAPPMQKIPTANPAPAKASVGNVQAFHQLGCCQISSIQRLLQEIDNETLAIALKGVDKDLFSFFWSTLPKERYEPLLQTMRAAIHVQVKDVKEAQTKILTAARELEKQGKITLDFPDGPLRAPRWEVIL